MKTLTRALMPLSMLAATLTLTTPAHAATTDPLAGHRCFTDTVHPEDTIENTIASIGQVAGSGARGAWCESDVWRLVDGTLAVWHDPTIGRVASTASLNALGLPGSTRIDSLTGDQYRQIVTEGGEPAATLDPFLRELGRLNVPAMFEIKNGLGDNTAVASVLNRATTYGAQVTWYGAPSSTCGVSSSLQRIKDAGGAIGFKMSPTCAQSVTPAAIASMVDLVSVSPAVLNADNFLLADRYDERGVYVVARHAGRTGWRALAQHGADRNLVDNVATWVTAR